ncbi:hypothetical protein M407DRAFT_246778 [Tulasnella calospora MUT 4182]|uniref:Uncharacterized protein n=1 Tax=Tulasnella calospora MUT 4182 TaxID=1051891 RepID=A0A0C3Q3T7_9AGAM|nr:hypothetical protein M407DRAFT_246778 [Tulasnella calospora MUT 4182]
MEGYKRIMKHQSKNLEADELKGSESGGGRITAVCPHREARTRCEDRSLTLVAEDGESKGQEESVYPTRADTGRGWT